MSISTHILDTSTGRPAAGIVVRLARLDEKDWILLQESRTDADGRVKSLLPEQYQPAENGETFRVRFETAPYFAAQQQASLYPYVDITFHVDDNTHYHIPLLLAANGYTTYRGS
jgi:5-hydroxyisourate hydrolase